MMRIITGTARGTKLATLAGENTRPTAERTKEAVFSMLQQWGFAERRVLDLFGGSGQLGLEALSRGAKQAVFADSVKEAVAVMTENAAKTRLADRALIHRAEALTFLKGYSGAPFHIVFLDPPYALGLVPKCLDLLLQRRLLTAGAVVVCETASAADVFGGDEALAAKFEIMRESRYGAAHICLITPKSEDLT